MTLSYLIIFVLLGCVLGSFYNVVGLRVPKGGSIVYPGSQCSTCHQQLMWNELIPVLSYLFIKGRCKNCNSKVSLLYPIMELISGLLFGSAFYIVGFNWELAVILTFISLLVIIVVSDISYMIISDKILLFFGILLAVLRIVEPLAPWWDSYTGAAGGFMLLFMIAVISRGGMGGGDIKLYAVIGLVLGIKLTLLSFFFAVLLATIAGLGGIWLGLWTRKEMIPFGPYIAVASLISYFFGNDLINHYIGWLS
ncbi:prepilin peptidase [Jeotgalibacillus sp. S-D1]|uniref:prepilin peptidase n=1 Tax=Jeotgalibacillus sp. S-D1 TaxID=2552189 RepID=UPI0010595448|nr:A24 family peptidase [Jeotgalibacillus sp. S-D1]TDL34406.1 prepilin peptidase [Jeotgalibacillus sp. S-D1]